MIAGQQAALGEFTRQFGAYLVSTRAEWTQIENDVLLSDVAPSSTGREHDFDQVGAFTVGAIRRVGRWLGAETGLGVNISTYAVPDALHTTYGSHPLSFQLFVQIRPHIGGLGPMWNMRMGE